MKVIYDDDVFFQQYANMPRSRGGLSAAGEWHQLKPLFPPLYKKSVLDLGCGYGWHCRYAQEKGAARILGIDLSEKMLEEARRRNDKGHIEYRLCGIEEYEYPADTWDCVVSNLALHYIEDLDKIFHGVWNTLKREGVFLFNIEHPVFTSGPGQDWIYDAEGRAQHWPVDDYFIAGRRETHFLGCTVVKYHHTLTQILGGLLDVGFTLEKIEEARPAEEMMSLPGMQDELRRPMMLLVKAVKR